MTGHGKVYEKINGKNTEETCKDCWFLLNETCTLHDYPTELTDYCGVFLPIRELEAYEDAQIQSLTQEEQP